MVAQSSSHGQGQCSSMQHLGFFQDWDFRGTKFLLKFGLYRKMSGIISLWSRDDQVYFRMEEEFPLVLRVAPALPARAAQRCLAGSVCTRLWL